jgi:hypothetical protein
VEIVENVDIDPPDHLRLGRRPVFRVGWDESEFTFETVRDGRFLQDGSTVVADGGQGQIVWISADGRLVRTWGGRGDGPGEFRWLNSILVNRDSVHAFDDNLRRITIFPIRGGDPTIVSIPDPLQVGFQPFAVLGDGVYLFRVFYWRPDTGPDRAWQYAPIIAWSVGESIDSITDLPTRQSQAGANRDPFEAYGLVASADSSIIHVLTDRAELRWYDFDGRLVRISRIPLTRRAPTREDWARYGERLAGQREIGSRLATYLRQKREVASDSMPLFASLNVASDGTIWLGEWSMDSHVKRYAIVAADGRWLGSVRAPERFRLLAVGTDAVLGVELNEWDVPAVAVYSLRE